MSKGKSSLLQGAGWPMGCQRLSRTTSRGSNQNRMNHQHWLDELAHYLRAQSSRQPIAPPPPELVAGLFQRQLELNEPAKTWLAQQDLLSTPVRSLTDLPAIPVSAFKWLELTTVPAADRIAVFHSSGTTQQMPSRHYHSRETLEIYQLALEIWFRHCLLATAPADAGRLDSPTLISLTPTAAEAPHSSLAHMIKRLNERAGHKATSSFHGRVEADGWRLDLPAAHQALRRAEAAGRPTVVLGTAFNFVHLLEGLAEPKDFVRLPPGSRVMETGGYKGRSREIPKPELHRQLAERLGISANLVISEYGMSELSSQAYDADLSATPPISARIGSRRFRFPPWCAVTIVSPETRRAVPAGEPGLLQIADLANVASVLAIQTEDLAVQHADGFELLGRATAAEARGCSLLPLEPRYRSHA
jgi:hypothetical protein